MTPERSGKAQGFDSSARRQILLLQGTRPFADENGFSEGEWGDERLTVLSELLPVRLSHRAPNLSRRRRALTRYDVLGLTARTALAPAG